MTFYDILDILDNILGDFFGILIVFSSLLGFLTIIPIWRFIEKADTVIHIYDLLKISLKFDLFQKGEVKILYGKHKLTFNNINEASIEIEKIAKEALEYYDKLNCIAIADNDSQIHKNKLLSICYELRMLR